MKFRVEREVVLYVEAEDAEQAVLRANAVPVEQWWSGGQDVRTTSYHEHDAERGWIVQKHAGLVDKYYHGIRDSGLDSVR